MEILLAVIVVVAVGAWWLSSRSSKSEAEVSPAPYKIDTPQVEPAKSEYSAPVPSVDAAAVGLVQIAAAADSPEVVPETVIEAAPEPVKKARKARTPKAEKPAKEAAPTKKTAAKKTAKKSKNT